MNGGTEGAQRLTAAATGLYRSFFLSIIYLSLVSGDEG